MAKNRVFWPKIAFFGGSGGVQFGGNPPGPSDLAVRNGGDPRGPPADPIFAKKWHFLPFFAKKSRFFAKNRIFWQFLGSDFDKKGGPKMSVWGSNDTPKMCNGGFSRTCF